MMYAGQIPLEIQLLIGYEVILALFMTFFLFVAFPPENRIFFGQWSNERLGAACVIGAMALTGMKGIVIGYISIAGVLIHLTILLAASTGGLLFSTTVAMIIAAIKKLCNNDHNRR